MELTEARARAQRCREVKSQGAGFTWTEDAAIALDDRITELELCERQLNVLLCDTIPDKKWNKVFKGSAIEYLRHRAVHFIKNYGDPVRGARMNQLANGVEEDKRRITELEAEMKQILNEFDEVEAQRDELVIVCKAALERCPFPVGAMAVKERLQNIARKHR